ncbi:MAG: hypothetical protein ACP5TX_04385 [Thermoplasmata archaeon]
MENSTVEIDLNELMENINLLDEVIIENLNGSYERKIRNIVARINKKYHLTMNEKDKMRLARRIQLELYKFENEGKVLKKNEKYVLRND